MIWANKKDFIFWQGNCTMNVLHLSLWKSFALNICSKDPMKNSTLRYFAKITLPTAKCIASSNYNVSLEDDYCVRFFDLKFFTPTLRHMFCSPNPSNIYGQRDFVSWKNIHFCGLKKESFISDGRYKWVLPKNMLSSYLVDIIFLRTFLV